MAPLAAIGLQHHCEAVEAYGKPAVDDTLVGPVMAGLILWRQPITHHDMISSMLEVEETLIDRVGMSKSLSLLKSVPPLCHVYMPVYVLRRKTTNIQQPSGCLYSRRSPTMAEVKRTIKKLPPIKSKLVAASSPSPSSDAAPVDVSDEDSADV